MVNQSAHFHQWIWVQKFLRDVDISDVTIFSLQIFQNTKVRFSTESKVQHCLLEDQNFAVPAHSSGHVLQEFRAQSILRRWFQLCLLENSEKPGMRLNKFQASLHVSSRSFFRWWSPSNYGTVATCFRTCPPTFLPPIKSLFTCLAHTPGWKVRNGVPRK